jgi:hypothetical protein
MSDLNEDLSEGLASTLTGSVGVPEDATTDDVLPNDLADAVEEQERYLAERGIPANNDVQDEAQYQADREAEQAQKPGRSQKVPLAALHEERTKRQELEQEAQQLRQQMQQLLAQQQAAQRAQLQAQQDAEIPDPDVDPIGFIKAKEAQFNARLEQLQNGHVQQPQVQQLEAQVMQEAAVLAPMLGEIEGRFTETTPDYPQAFDHVMAAVDQNMRAQHPGINEQQLGMLRTAALVTLAKQCQSNGVSPAAYVYQRAQAMGYQPASRAPRKEPPTSLSNAHGSTRAPDERSSVHASDISNMSEAEFDQYWNNMKRGATVRPAI